MVTGLEEFVIFVSNARQKSLESMYLITMEWIKSGFVQAVMTKGIKGSVELTLKREWYLGESVSKYPFF